MPWSFSDMYGRQKVVDANVFPVMVPIFDTTLTGSQATIDIQNIPQTYTHLKVMIQARCDVANTTTTILVRFNGDSSGNYDYESYIMRGTNNNSAGAAATGIAWQGLTAASDTATGASVFEINVPNYTATTFRKQAVGTGWAKDAVDGTSASYQSIIGGGEWRSTAAINRLTFLPNSGNFIAGTRVTVYGIGVTAPASPGSVLPVTYGTTLPASPLDGQEAILVDNVNTPTYQWRFRYNANSANTDKWEFVGGVPIMATASGTVSNGSTGTWQALSGGPSITLPNAGIYVVRWGHNSPAVPTNSAQTSIAVNGNTTPVTPLNLFSVETASGNPAGGGVSMEAILTTRSNAAGLLQMIYNSASTSNSYNNRWLSVLPVRVS